MSPGGAGGHVIDPEDFRWMGAALAVAERGRGLTAPNPAVGAVLVAAGVAVGEGAHLRAGTAHAEVVALAAAGERARGATLYVTLEPCAHHGRTPPCTEAIAAAGVRRVVVATGDPDTRVDGRGLTRLAEAGVSVVVGVREAEARAQNRGFFSVATTGRPHVTLKTAMTLDGRIVGADGASRWITGEAARAEAHRLRFLAEAVVVGIGTVLADDPSLTVRRADLPSKEPLRVVVDSGLRLPPDARVMSAGDAARVVVACAGVGDGSRARTLRERGVRVVEAAGPGGRVDLAALLVALRNLDVLSVLVEGGAELAAGFLDAGLVDRVAFFVAPRLVGGRGVPGPVGGAGRALARAISLSGLQVRPVGEDVLIEADVVTARSPGGLPDRAGQATPRGVVAAPGSRVR